MNGLSPVWQEELIQDKAVLVFVTEVEHDCCHQQVVGIHVQDRLLPSVYDVQLSRVLLSTYQMLGGHVDVELYDLVVVRIASFINEGDISELVVCNLQVVACVLHTEVCNRLPTALVQEIVGALPCNATDRDVNRRLRFAGAAEWIMKAPAALVSIVPMWVGLAVLPIHHREVLTCCFVGLHSISGQVLSPDVACWHGPWQLGGVNPGNCQAEHVELFDADVEGSLKDHPPH
mmetsp:Transcript_131841/g.328741  ORF Transcript_131841/g.328741 Transcript_131841/m.328741 type:complete len:232 (+) Transcript_131841:641-1336(+)